MLFLQVNDRVIATWCAILKAVPSSRLLMKCKPFASAAIRKKVGWLLRCRLRFRLQPNVASIPQFLKRFQQQGIEPKRVDLVQLLPTTSGQSMLFASLPLLTFAFASTSRSPTCAEHLASYSMVDIRFVH